MNGFLVLLRKEIKEQFKTSKVIVVAAVFLFFGLGTPLLVKYMPLLLETAGTAGVTIEMPDPTSAEALVEYSSTMAQFGVLMAVLVAMGAIAKEAETGTALMVLSKPVGRLAFILAKLKAEVFTFFLAFLLGGLACWGYTLILFGDANVLGFYPRTCCCCSFLCCVSLLPFSSPR
jgi:ABC-2 type transport system permease protein